jgi:TPR repeat protein
MRSSVHVAVLATIALAWSCPLFADFAKGKAAYDRKDYATAFSEWSESAQRGDRQSQVRLGLMYFRGEGIARDEAKAAAWYRKAAEQGFAPAQIMLGVLEKNGRGVALDYAEALTWFQKAAAQGDAKGQF